MVNVAAQPPVINVTPQGPDVRVAPPKVDVQVASPKFDLPVPSVVVQKAEQWEFEITERDFEGRIKRIKATSK